VAIKKITKKKVVDVTKKLLWEIKQVRDVTSENTVRYSSFNRKMFFVLFRKQEEDDSQDFFNIIQRHNIAEATLNCQFLITY